MVSTVRGRLRDELRPGEGTQAHSSKRAFSEDSECWQDRPMPAAEDNENTCRVLRNLCHEFSHKSKDKYLCVEHEGGRKLLLLRPKEVSLEMKADSK